MVVTTMLATGESCGHVGSKNSYNIICLSIMCHHNHCHSSFLSEGINSSPDNSNAALPHVSVGVAVGVTSIFITASTTIGIIVTVACIVIMRKKGHMSLSQPAG